MKKVKIIVLIIFFCIPSINALALTMAMTTTDSLNVRSAPAGKVIDSLPKESLVSIMSIQGSWAQVVYMDNTASKNVKSGWVYTKYLQIISSGRGSFGAGFVSGDDCELEYETESEVCVSVADVDLDCRESYDGNYYRSCEVEVEYEVSTNYEGDDYLDVDVECTVEIKYKGRDSYSWRYDSDYENENHSLYSYGSEYGDMSFDFSFSSYKEVISVKIDSVSCEINSVSHW